MEQPSVISPEGIKITDQLRVEHGLLRAMMAAVGDWLVAGIPPEAMRERAAMLSTALDTHARREEERLFTPLRPLSETARHLVDMMEIVHDEVRAQFGEIASHADPIPRLWTILDLTSTHFDKEDAEVFPMAELLIEPAKLIQLGAG